MASRKITDMALPAQKAALDFLIECGANDLDVLIICTYRTGTEQDALYAQGRTAPGRIVTHAKAGESRHNLTVDGRAAAMAFDAVPMRNGKILWDATGESSAEWQRMGAIAKKIGLAWGGDWPGVKQDFPHFELK